MNLQALLARVRRGNVHNVAFADFRGLIRAFGFALVRISASHFLFAHPDIPALFNAQKVGGEAKPYQIRQFLKLVERYNLSMKDRR